MFNRIEGYFQEAKGGTLVIKNVQLLTFEKQSVLLHILEQEHPRCAYHLYCQLRFALLKMVADETFRDNLFFILPSDEYICATVERNDRDIPDIADYLLTSHALCVLVQYTGHISTRYIMETTKMMRKQ